MNNQQVLRTIKLSHTVIWTFFVACVIAIPAGTADADGRQRGAKPVPG
jgi:hypothetical protein